MTYRHLSIVLSLCLMPLWIMAQVPDISLRNTDGEQVSLTQLCTDGTPTIISFFATWCKPCLRELNAIAEVYDDWQEETGVKLVAVSIDRAQDIEKVKPLADGNNWDYIVLLDTDNRLKQMMQVQTVPHVFVVDGKGKIIEQHSGYVDGEEKNLYRLIKQLK